MLYFEWGNKNGSISQDTLKRYLFRVFGKLGSKKRVLAIPPDFTRFHSSAGPITELSWEYYNDALTDILPALGTHSPMTSHQIRRMFGETPEKLFRVHNWRRDLVTLGEVPSEFIEKVSEGKLNYSWPAQVNKLLVEGGYDLILSIGQVVPHEVIGMANYNKNIFVGTGGSEGINKSHFLGAVFGMERIMGRTRTPVRDVLDYASYHFGRNLPIIYILTVIGKDNDGQLQIRGLYIGDDEECFHKASKLALDVNFTILEKPLNKVVVYLDPSEYKSTWLGDKSIYRTRMAIADGGELIILAPGLKEFGEDPEIDLLIRKYGYRTTAEILKFTADNQDLRENLSAAAHLIHGSSEDRFRITYCTGQLTREDIENVNYQYADPGKMMRKYDPETVRDGFNMVDGEEIFFISNPALGLWSTRERFKDK
jgi:nickel-dependent lactate racemase